MKEVEIKKLTLQLAKSSQYQLHPACVRKLIEALQPLDDTAAVSVLRSVFVSLQDACAGGNREISADMMTHCIELHLASSLVNTRQSSFSVLALNDFPLFTIDEITGQPLIAETQTCDRIAAMRARYCNALHRCLRSGLYRRNSSSSGEARTLVSIAALEGISCNAEVSVLGLLSFAESTKAFSLEDSKNSIVLDLSCAETPQGFCGSGLIVVVTGRWNGCKFDVARIELPPAESRAQSLSHLGSFDAFGGALPDPIKALDQEVRMHSSVIAVLSHVHLDSSKCIDRLTKFFSEFSSRRDDELTEICFVLVGDFCSSAWSAGDISHLGDSSGRHYFQGIVEHFVSTIHQVAANVCAHSTFVFVPGPNDPCALSAVAPQSSLSAVFLQPLKTRFKKVLFASNPARIRFFTQEIVVCRRNFFYDLHHSCNRLSTQSLPIPQYELLTKTLCESAHLAPFSQSVVWKLDAALTLYPLPSLLLLCDKTEQWECRYRGTTVINPGNFTVSGTFLWYTPADKEFSLNRVLV